MSTKGVDATGWEGSDCIRRKIVWIVQCAVPAVSEVEVARPRRRFVAEERAFCCTPAVVKSLPTNRKPAGYRLGTQFTSCCCWLRSCRGLDLLALFLLPMAMKENEGESKQAEDEGVFLWFGDD